MDDSRSRAIAVFIISLLKSDYITPGIVASFISAEWRKIEDAHRLDAAFISSLNRSGTSVATRKVAYAIRDSDDTWDDLEAEAKKILNQAHAQGLSVLHPFMKSYPKRLLRSDDYPPILYYKGDPSVTNHEKVAAIVGTSDPTEFGQRMERRFTQLLVDDGYVVISDLGKGCPSIAHEGALDAGGRTIAILGDPIDRHLEEDGLANRIIDAGGVLLSEHAPGTKNLRPRTGASCDRHNDWMAALSDGVVAVEMSFSDRSWRTMEYAIKASVPTAAFDYRNSDKLRFRFESELRFKGSLHYLASGRGVAPIWGQETVNVFERWMDSYRSNEVHSDSGDTQSIGDDYLRTAALRYIHLTDEDIDFRGATLDEGARDMAYRLACMMHGEDIAEERRKRRINPNTRDKTQLLHGTCGSCTWAIDSDGLLLIYPTNGVCGTLKLRDGVYGVLRWWPWLEISPSKHSRFHMVDYAERIKAAFIGDGVAVQDCSYFFHECENMLFADLSRLKVLETRGFDSMFSRCYRLRSFEPPTGTERSAIRATSAMRHKPVRALADAIHGTCDACSWVIDSNGLLSIRPTDGISGSMEKPRVKYGTSTWPWQTHRDKITAVSFEKGVIAPERISSLFSQYRNLQQADLSNLDTSRVTSMQMLFYGCPSLKTVDLSGLDTSSLVDVREMFQNCSLLTSADFSGWDTSVVTNMDRVFYGCKSLGKIDVSGWKTSSVESMKSMFYGCSSLVTLDLSSWETPALAYVEAENGLRMAEGLFTGCTSLESLNLSGWNTSAIASMRSLFANCSSLVSLDVSDWDTSSVTDMSDMFRDCSSLASLDISSWNTHAVKSMRSMFQRCSALTVLDVSDWDTSSLTDMWDTFHGCHSLVSLDLSRWDTSALNSLCEAFRDCSSLKSLEISDWDTSNIANIRGMFQGCSSLSTLDLSGWNLSRVVAMGHAFHGCSSLVSLDLSGWDTSSAKDLHEAFRGCTSLKCLDLSCWSTVHVHNMKDMFSRCTSLARITVGPLFDVSEAFPDATNSRGEWLSKTENRWYTVAEIKIERVGLADTYVSQLET